MKDEIINQQIQVQKQQVSKIFKTTSQVFGNMGFSFLNLQLIMEGFWQILLYVYGWSIISGFIFPVPDYQFRDRRLHSYLNSYGESFWLNEIDFSITQQENYQVNPWLKWMHCGLFCNISAVFLLNNVQNNEQITSHSIWATAYPE